jgi:hypothetical protein
MRLEQGRRHTEMSTTNRDEIFLLGLLKKHKRLSNSPRSGTQNTLQSSYGGGRSCYRELTICAKPSRVPALDKSIDKACQGLSKALSTIEKKTSSEHLELLKSYRSLLQKQVEFVDSEI